MYKILITDEFGRGIYSTKSIYPDEIVAVCELLILNPLDTISIRNTDLRYYVFKFSETQDCLCLGDGEIFNHNTNANVSFNLEKKDNRYVMVFRSKFLIAANEQLFINYASDEKVDILNYINKKSLIA